MPTEPRTTRNTLNDERTHAIIGAALEVQNTLGPGFLERVYQLALAIEFRARGIPFEMECQVPITYKGERLACGYRLDFLCFGNIVVETKAMEILGAIELAQVINYLKAGDFPTGLLLNFGDPKLEIRRVLGPAALRTGSM